MTLCWRGASVSELPSRPCKEGNQIRDSLHSSVLNCGPTWGLVGDASSQAQPSPELGVSPAL